MKKDDLSYILVSAVEETEEDKEIEKQANTTFVSADPDDYDEEGYDEEEGYYIDADAFDTLANTIQSMQHILNNVSTLLTARTDEQLTSLPVNAFSELTHLLSATKSKALIIKDMACDYTIN